MLKSETFFLKNMLSESCIKLVGLYFTRYDNINLLTVALGEVQLQYNPSETPRTQIINGFRDLGFDIVKDPNVEIAEKTKVAAIELIYKASNINSLIRNSDYISERLQLPYEKISKVFSQVTGTTLEKYIILLKIEKAKEMIVHNDYSLSEISWMLGYSSVQYLSNQFKKITGITVSQFKENPAPYRIPLERLI